MKEWQDLMMDTGRSLSSGAKRPGGRYDTEYGIGLVIADWLLRVPLALTSERSHGVGRNDPVVER